MIEDFDPDLHGQIIEKLELFQSQQLNYLRALMRPNSEGKPFISRQQKGNCQDSSAIKEFRWIVTMIMDSYRFQGSVLEVTSKLAGGANM
ncbi:hypothetical protein PPACK8108_LOCUS4034 [Phakopsora pachyrhizi]|uniref:Uncharacterized protein n=1 Tax=Phakopsora pachyrhizi TaxID=170000 RepID=A0AAV0ANB9_PHAPC|nr:hypothetical protein PPACK8108_LOCUS4034 [Phakopsora pachyrhizi]